MIDKLPGIRASLEAAKGQRGRLTKIAIDCDVSFRTIQTIIGKPEYKPSAATIDKLAAYFKKIKRQEDRNARQQENS